MDVGYEIIFRSIGSNGGYMELYEHIHGPFIVSFPDPSLFYPLSIKGKG